MGSTLRLESPVPSCGPSSSRGSQHRRCPWSGCWIHICLDWSAIETVVVIYSDHTSPSAPRPPAPSHHCSRCNPPGFDSRRRSHEPLANFSLHSFSQPFPGFIIPLFLFSPPSLALHFLFRVILSCGSQACAGVFQVRHPFLLLLLIFSQYNWTAGWSLLKEQAHKRRQAGTGGDVHKGKK